jgi:hypothetical protein
MKNTFNDSKHPYMTPLEHYLFASPFNMDKDIYEQLVVALGNLPSDKIKIIAKFIKSHQKYYYPLTQIYNEIKHERIIDCSSSIFLSKCHLLFLENYISMVSFINDFRKFI